MKLGTVSVLSLLIAVLGIVPIASAIPLGVSEITQSGGLAVSEIAKSSDGLGVNPMASGGVSSLHFRSTSSAQSVPVSESTFVLFGAGFVVLAMWYQRFTSRYAKFR